jgi:hypothetical protein
MAFGRTNTADLRSVPARWLGLLTCAVAVAVVFAAAALAPSRAAAAASCSVQNGFGTFSESNEPGACWRPYSDDSPFNRRIPFGAPSGSESPTQISGLLAGGDVSQLVFGDYERDGGVSVYWSKPTDPVYTLNCTKPWSGCDLDGLQIHVPAQAIPTGGWSDTWEHDAHMTVVDQQSGWEYDMWQVWNESGSTLNFSWGGKTRIDGDGLDSDAVSARYGSLAGPIRPEEISGGQINHALTMVVPCTNTYVYPAVQKSLTCGEAGLPDSMSVPMGAHIQLRMSKRAIKRLDVPQWKKTIVRALSTYGADVTDTAGAGGHWGFETASSQTYTSYGQPDPWVQWARSLGVQPEDFNGNGASEYWLNLEAGVPWDRMRVVDECAAHGTCATISLRSVLRKRAHSCRRSLHSWKRRMHRSESRSLHSGPVKRTRVRWENRCQRLRKRALHA